MIILPFLEKRTFVEFCTRKWGLIVPPVSLVPSWLLGAVLIIDWPTGEEEELGEMVFSLCLFLLAWGQWQRVRQDSSEPDPDS